MSQPQQSHSKKNSPSTLTPMQKHLLELFSFDLTKKEMTELRNLLVNYYNLKVTSEASKIWKEKKLSNRQLNNLLKAS